MRKVYRYDHRSAKHHRTAIVIIVVVVLLIAPIVYFVYRDIVSNSSSVVDGQTKVVGQVVGGDDTGGFKVDEPLFSMTLPSDWKQTGRFTSTTEQSITWQAGKKNEDNRWLKLYIDTIPADIAVNRMLPVTVNGDSLTTGDVSDSCATFTGGGTLDAQKATLLRPAPAKWQGVDFICNLPSVVENQVGVAAVGGVNKIVIEGPTKGTHTYFFVYTDHNIQPNYTILSDAVESFRAK